MAQYHEFFRQLTDADPTETAEWMESLEAVVQHEGPERAEFLILRLLQHARGLNVDVPQTVQTPYVNTIPTDREATFPGDEDLERRIRRLVRWNAAVMVTRANKNFEGLGGHISTYASAASLYEVGFNHFFRGKDGDHAGDQIYFQGHAAPGIYARAYLEGRLTEAHLDRFRREVKGEGLSSYPHPRLMPEFWEFPTVSMGLGPINAIYQARFNRYLAARGLADTRSSMVWAFLGDGETDEPEALGALSLAGREKLDNLIFVVNCNLQRLDGPVRGNGKIIQELESVFHGAGWNVIKVIWGREWDELFANDHEGLLLKRMTEIRDGDFQRFPTESGAKLRETVFGKYPKLLKLVEHLSDEQLRRLRRGGHDYRKVYSAYHRALRSDKPTVILAKTVKGWTLGEGFEARNVTHQKKKMDEKELRVFRDLLELPIPDSKLHDAPFYHPGEDSEEVRYMLERRRVLGGCVPKRRVVFEPVKLPEPDAYAEFREGSGDKVKKDGTRLTFSTTMAFVKLLGNLLKTEEFGERIVPIVPDEARTFGMEPLFRAIGIYAAEGQQYTPVDARVFMHYAEAKDGQMLQEGITEAGAMASFTAASTSYATHRSPTIPFYIFYSMFGFQRIGDLIWAMADARGRGFLLGATAGRTTLNGEGLQHQDGHSHLLAATVPCCCAYDPAFAYEIAVVVEDGLRRMYRENEDVFYYLTVYNENIVQEAMPEREGVREGIIKGLYRFREGGEGRHKAQIIGSGVMLSQALEAADFLAEHFDVSADVWSAPSFGELRKEALACEEWSRHNPGEPARVPYVTECLAETEGPIVTVSDYMKAVADQVARFVPRPMISLGTEGFGCSDTREALRRHFQNDAAAVVLAVLSALIREGALEPEALDQARERLGVDHGVDHDAELQPR